MMEARSATGEMMKLLSGCAMTIIWWLMHNKVLIILLRRSGLKHAPWGPPVWKKIKFLVEQILDKVTLWWTGRGRGAGENLCYDKKWHYSPETVQLGRSFYSADWFWTSFNNFSCTEPKFQWVLAGMTVFWKQWRAPHVFESTRIQILSDLHHMYVELNWIWIRYLPVQYSVQLSPLALFSMMPHTIWGW